MCSSNVCVCVLFVISLVFCVYVSFIYVCRSLYSWLFLSLCFSLFCFGLFVLFMWYSNVLYLLCVFISFVFRVCVCFVLCVGLNASSCVMFVFLFCLCVWYHSSPSSSYDVLPMFDIRYSLCCVVCLFISYIVHILCHMFVTPTISDELIEITISVYQSQCLIRHSPVFH